MYYILTYGSCAFSSMLLNQSDDLCFLFWRTSTTYYCWTSSNQFHKFMFVVFQTHFQGISFDHYLKKYCQKIITKSKSLKRIPKAVSCFRLNAFNSWCASERLLTGLKTWIFWVLDTSLLDLAMQVAVSNLSPIG